MENVGAVKELCKLTVGISLFSINLKNFDNVGQKPHELLRLVIAFHSACVVIIVVNW